MQYTPPTTEDLARLKAALGFTGKQMAELFGVSADFQWRKYTGGHSPREMSMHMLFFAMARMELQPAVLERVLERMRAVGASVDLSSPE